MRQIKMDVPGIGPATVEVGELGIVLRRGQRTVSLVWDDFWAKAVVPVTAPAKFHASLTSKRQWLIEGRKEGADAA